MSSKTVRVAIQGELGSNSHMAVRAVFREAVITPCERTAELLERLVSGEVDAAVLPFENTLHGSVAEHYDLMLEQPVRMAGESLLRIRHNLIAAPGARLSELRRVLSHPVALSQCRRWLAAHPALRAESFYDTAGSVKLVVEQRMRDAAGIAPALAADVYGGELLAEGIEDHPRNYTRFHTLVREADAEPMRDGEPDRPGGAIDKLSVAFSLEHRPGTLVRALAELAATGADLTRIESRPVHGSPWEYVFFVDLRCEGSTGAERALRSLRPLCGTVRELGRYRAAGALAD